MPTGMLGQAVTPAIHLVFQGGDRSGVFCSNVRRIGQVIKRLGGRVSVGQLEVWVSPARLAKYRQSSDPVALYVWSSELSAAIFELIGHVEVLLRNTIHVRLSLRFGSLPWYDDPYYHFNSQTI